MTRLGTLTRLSSPPRIENRYCSRCLVTRSFVDLGPALRCPTCTHELRRR